MNTFTNQTSLSGEGWSVTVEQKMDTYSGNFPDPSWSCTDKHGHVHRWVENKLPTLELVADEWSCDEDDGEEYISKSHYVCHECGETVEPRRSYQTKTHCIGALIKGEIAKWLDVGKTFELQSEIPTLRGQAFCTEASKQLGGFDSGSQSRFHSIGKVEVLLDGKWFALN